ncbi:glycosyl hydrolase [Primorskyibacter aestuariivivens]|uniref:glycosyl hydrolase n=1 Tax=Primorskyibacter aestuariivivens TaxID=1888912 RepID=UPI0023000ED1|nr:glycosyl hydrolase [Primorskyibacter aestuariivivens]MDA7430551.1 glycosyl hydrolase [Primorskyibacter aestuariivivens]
MAVIQRFLILLGFVLMTQTVAAQQAGVGAWENKSYTTLKWIESQQGLKWYYNWRTDQIHARGGPRRRVEFVPMIHNASNVNDPIRSDRPVRALLGFNEPDGHGGDHQAGMSVAEAIALWPKLEAHGLRLGSPATTQFGTLGRNSWLGRFMAEAERRNLRVDFMAVHYYSPDGDVIAFRDWLIDVYKAYDRPIWVTEFAMIDWNRPGRATYDANAKFAYEAIRMMETLPFVERHAWFAANPYPWKGTPPKINLVDHNMERTPLGVAFDEVLSGRAPEQVASAD